MTISTQRIRAGCAAAALVGLLAGCGAVSGVAVKDPGAPGAGDVQLGLLVTGPYPTEPTAAMGLAGPRGLVIEGQRMAEYVVGPWEVDATLLYPDWLPTVPLKDAEMVGNLIGDPSVAEVARAHRFVAGFSAPRSSARSLAEADHDLKRLLNVVLRFPDPLAASAAAAELAATARYPSEDPATVEPIAIPHHRAARAVSYNIGEGGRAVTSFAAHGSYVIYNYAFARKGVDVAAELIALNLDLQMPRLDLFSPTSPGNLADLPLDPSGLLAKTLPMKSGPIATSGMFEPFAALHYQSDPVKSKRWFDDVDLQEMSQRGQTVFAVKNEAAAVRLAEDFATEMGDRTGSRFIDRVAGLPDSRCFEDQEAKSRSVRYSCVVAAGRYTILASAGQIRDLHQQTAAQYLLLVGDR